MASSAGSDAVLLLLALTVVFITGPAMFVSVFYSIPYAVRRIRRYGVKGSAHRLFAQFTLFQTVVPTICLVLFFSVGIVLASMPDTPERAGIARILLLVAIALIALQVVVSPIGHSYIEAAAERERDEMKDEMNDRKDH